ncbi:putative F-box protein At3g21120 [Daucus carota subsp. sativus]|uniref:putative F-box protein At3g21120 n=1 Tax=Daucus carota subsp. sativus TaxID=79200 RepID=UPI003082D2E0
MSRLTRGKRKRVSPALKSGRPGKKMKPIPELPQELFRDEILSRLPIESVSRFKSVCKSWLSLFSDPHFVKQHNDRLNPKENDLLVIRKYGHIAIISRYQEQFLLRNDDDWNLIGSAKGLVSLCCRNVVSLWNPAIHQSKEFHLPPLVYGCLCRAGLGYDPLSKDYKVGICYRSLDKLRLCYAVYSSSSASWIHYQFDDRDVEIVISDFENKSLTPTTMVRDSPYWTTSSTTISSSNEEKAILCLDAFKFDATSNRFKLLPRYSSEFSKDKKFKVVCMRDLLSFMAYERCPVCKLEVYSLDEDKGCKGGVWSKMYSFGPFLRFRRFDCLQQGFKYGDEIVINEYGDLTRFNHKLGTFERIPGVMAPDTGDCFTYTPSLVSLPGMTSIYLENQTPLPGHHPTIRPLRLVNSLRDHLPLEKTTQVFN